MLKRVFPEGANKRGVGIKLQEHRKRVGITSPVPTTCEVGVSKPAATRHAVTVAISDRASFDLI